MPGPGRNAATEATLRMPPRWRARLSTKASDNSVSARILTSIIASCSSRSRSAAEPTSPKPALLTTFAGSSPRRGQLLGDARDGIAPFEVDADNGRPRPPGCGDLIGERVEPVFAPRHQCQFMTAIGEHAGKLSADAGRGAGDERHRFHASLPVLDRFRQRRLRRRCGGAMRYALCDDTPSRSAARHSRLSSSSSRRPSA